MSGNADELPDDSSRLRDRASDAIDRARGESTRLREQTTSAFQRRRQQAAQAREAIAEGRDRFADALDIPVGGVEPVQLDDRGEDIGFVPTDEGRDELASRFADDRPFVDADDALVDADPRGGVETMTAPAARPEIAAEAREETAADAEFIQPGDLDAEVGPGGVQDVGLTDQGARRRAGRQFEAETPLSDVDPASDLRETGDGFGLARDPAREVAAERIDEQTPNLDVGVDDIDLEDTGDGFEAVFEREVTR